MPYNHVPKIIQTMNKMIDLKPNYLDGFVFLRFIYLCLHTSLCMGYSVVAMHRLLSVVVSLTVQHRL